MRPVAEPLRVVRRLEEGRVLEVVRGEEPQQVADLLEAVSSSSVTKLATPDFGAWVMAPPSSSWVTSSPVTVFTTSGPVMYMCEVPLHHEDEVGHGRV